MAKTSIAVVNAQVRWGAARPEQPTPLTRLRRWPRADPKPCGGPRPAAFTVPRMSSFATHRRRVHDESLTPRARHANLRACVVAFAPYGYRATYHHVCAAAGIPRSPERAPEALVRAVEELHLARLLWLADERAYVERRRTEKARGRRQPPRDGSWRRRLRESGHIAFCPDPSFHPTEPLPVVVERVLRSSIPPGAPDGSACRACGHTGDTVPWSDGFLYDHTLCGRCGVSLAADPAGQDLALGAAREAQWKEIWRLRGEYGEYGEYGGYGEFGGGADGRGGSCAG